MAHRTLRETLEHWRQIRGLSVGKLVQMTGIHRATWARWKKGESLPSTRELEAVLTLLDVPAADRKTAMRDWDAPRALVHLRREESNLPMALGDLLRALRLRAQQTQAETARQAGITQGLLARWENHGGMPDAAKLHTLCFVLDATGEETAALTTGAYREHPPLPDNETDREDAFNQLVYHTDTDHKDLMYLAHTAHLIRFSRSGTAFKEQLADVWGRQAIHVARQPGRETDAVRYGNAALASSNRAGTFNSHVVCAVIAVANTAAKVSGARAGISCFECWDMYITHPELRQWMTARIAEYLANSGDMDGAVTLMRDVYIQARERRADTYGDFLSRRRDYAEILLRAGDGATALAALTDGRIGDIDGFSPSELCRDTLLIAEANVQVKQKNEASHFLNKAVTLIRQHNLPFNEQANRMTYQLQ